MADRIGEACRRNGFFYVQGHGVDARLCDEALGQTRAFFDLPEADKQAVDKTASRANRGYEPLGGQTLEPGTAADLKEGFYIGLDLPPDDPRVQAGRFNHGANQWPAGPPGFRPVMEAYYQAMLALARRLMRALGLSLGLAENQFDAFCHEPLAILRLLHYPPQPPAGAGQGAGAHTDFGALTLLLQDGQGGLEVLDRDRDGWIPAPPIPGTFVVNLGDLIARWTDDLYASTPHRVVNRSGQERYSVPFFFSGAPDYRIESLPGLAPSGMRPRYPVTTVEGHLREMYRRTYGPAYERD